MKSTNNAMDSMRLQEIEALADEQIYTGRQIKKLAKKVRRKRKGGK